MQFKLLPVFFTTKRKTLRVGLYGVAFNRFKLYTTKGSFCIGFFVLGFKFSLYAMYFSMLYQSQLVAILDAVVIKG